MLPTAPPRRASRAAAGARTVAALALLAAALAACRGPMTIAELDHLARTTGARTILHEQDFSLYSPFDLHGTRDWLRLVEEQLAEVAELLGADPAEQREREGMLIVRLHPVQGLRGQLRAEGENSFHFSVPEGHPMHGVEGFASGRQAIVLVEAPMELRFADGRTLPGSWSASTFQSTLRHELAHVVARSAGIHGEDWLDEGIATLVEHSRPDVAGERARLDPRALRTSRHLARSRPALAELLLVDEDVEAILAGRVPADEQWRPRLFAFFAFLLERELANGGSLRSTLEAARRAGRAELVRLEPAWVAWLEPGPLDEGPEPAAQESDRHRHEP